MFCFGRYKAPSVALRGFCMRISEVLAQFKKQRSFSKAGVTVKKDVANVRSLGFFLNDCELSKIRLEDILRYYELHEAFGFDPNTLSPRAVSIKMFFRFAKQLNVFIAFDPELIPIPAREFRMPDEVKEEEYQALLGAIPKKYKASYIRDEAIIKLLKKSGLRIGELVKLKAKNVDLEKKKGLVKTEKKKTRIPFDVFFWDDEANDALMRWIEERNKMKDKMFISDNLFIGLAGKGLGKEISTNGVRVMIKRYCEKAGIRIIHPHQFRHAFAIEGVNKGATPHQIKNAMRHKDIRSSDPYTFMDDKVKQENYENIWG